MFMITVTPEQVKENMKDFICKTVIEFDKPVTYVTLRMKNGFTLRESTTCVDPANYDEAIGCQICLEKLEDKVWFLLGYALQDQVTNSKNELNATAYQMMSPDYKERFKAEYNQVLIRYNRLSSMLIKWGNGELSFTPTCDYALFEKQLQAMRSYLDVLETRAVKEKVEL